MCIWLDTTDVQYSITQFSYLPSYILDTSTMLSFGGEGRHLNKRSMLSNQRRTYADVTAFNSNDTRICRYDNGVHSLPHTTVRQRCQHTIHVQFSRYVINSDCEFHRTYRRHAQYTLLSSMYAYWEELSLDASTIVTVCRTVVRATRLVDGKPRILHPGIENLWIDWHQTR